MLWLAKPRFGTDLGSLWVIHWHWQKHNPWQRDPRTTSGNSRIDH